MTRRGSRGDLRGQDVIDSRDVIERISELEDSEELDEGERDELADLKALEDQAGSAPDWEHGEGLIRDSYFEEYAQQLAEDIGAIKDNASWPYTCIDWERAANELKHDYMRVRFGDEHYWIRG